MSIRHITAILLFAFGIGNTTLVATGNINITAEKDRDYSDKKTGTSKQMDHAMHDDETVRGATIQSGGNIALSAGDATLTPGTNSGNVNIASGYLASQNGNITVAATNDITLTTTSEHHETLSESYRKTSSLTSTKTTTTRDHTTYDAAVGATLSGDSVAMQAGHDLTVQGSTVAATNDVLLKAGNNINVTAATETYSQEHYSKTTKSGLLSANTLALSVGSQSQAMTDTVEGTLAKGSLIGSNEGRIDLIAGGDANITGSQLGSKTGIGISAANINITAAEQTETSTHAEQFKQSGLTLRARGGAADVKYASEGKKMEGALISEDERVRGVQKYTNAFGAINSDGIESNFASGLIPTIAVSMGNQTKESNSTQTSVTHAGSTIKTEGDITLIARGSQDTEGTAQAGTGNLTIAGSYVSAGGALGMKAANDINIVETIDSLTTQTDARNKRGNQYGNKTIADTTNSTQTAANGTIITADSITAIAGRDLTVRGSTLAAENDIALRAERDVVVTAAVETQTGGSAHSVNKNGLFDSGQLSITMGNQKQGLGEDQVTTTAIGSLIGSTHGRIDIYSGGETRVVGSELFSQTGLSIDADRINILPAAQNQEGNYTQTFSQAGLNLRLQGGIVNAALQLINTIDRATEVKDDRLQALYAARAARQAYGLSQNITDVATAGDNFQKTTDTANASGEPAPEGSKAGAAGAAAGIEVAVSIGSKTSRNESIWNSTEYVGSNVSTAGDLTLHARGEDRTGANGSGNILIAGSNLTGQNVSLIAANDINILSAADVYMQDSKNKNSGWEGGVAFTLGQGGVGIKIFVEMEQGKGFEKGNGTTQNNSLITAQDTFNLVSGRDTTIAGGQIRGGTVNMDVGRDLTLTSLQDTDFYDAKQEQISGGASFTYGSMSVEAHASYNQSKTNNNYASVGEGKQTGIYAGTGGFNINVGNHTSLTGAVIASDAEASQNRLSTQTISFSDINNHAEYSSQSFGVSAGGGSNMQSGKTTGAATPNIGIKSTDSASGVTHSAIADGEIIVRSDYDENGIKIKDSLAGLSNDLKNASGSLENKFDLDKIQTNQELGRLVGEEGYWAIGEVTKKIRDAKVKDIYNSMEKNEDGTLKDKAAFDAKVATLDSQIGDGSLFKTGLHAGIGALEAAWGGGDALGGALGAGAGEYIKGTETFKKIGDSPLSDFAKNVVSMGAGYIAGGNSGASTALDGDKYNRALHKDELAIIHKLAQEIAADSNTRTELGISDSADANMIESMLLKAVMQKVHAGDEDPEGLYNDPSIIRSNKDVSDKLLTYIEKIEQESNGKLFKYGPMDELRDRMQAAGYLKPEANDVDSNLVQWKSNILFDKSLAESIGQQYITNRYSEAGMYYAYDAVEDKTWLIGQKGLEDRSIEVAVTALITAKALASTGRAAISLFRSEAVGSVASSVTQTGGAAIELISEGIAQGGRIIYINGGRAVTAGVAGYYATTRAISNLSTEYGQNAWFTFQNGYLALANQTSNIWYTGQTQFANLSSQTIILTNNIYDRAVQAGQNPYYQKVIFDNSTAIINGLAPNGLTPTNYMTTPNLFTEPEWIMSGLNGYIEWKTTKTIPVHIENALSEKAVIAPSIIIK